jgi:hypothetical protein
MKQDPFPIFRSVTVMVDGCGVHGRKNSMCSVCTSGWFSFASVLVKWACAAEVRMAATQPPRSTVVSSKQDSIYERGWSVTYSDPKSIPHRIQPYTYANLAAAD